MIQSSAATAGLMALFMVSAAAQTPSAGQDPAAAKTIATVPDGSLQRVQNAWRGRRLIGTPVFGDSGEQVAVINDLLISDDGTVGAVVLSVSIGRQLVKVPFSQLRFVPSQRRGVHALRMGARVGAPDTGPFGVMLPGVSRKTLASMETFRFRSPP